ncbi:MAG: beta strand repeat-containing protein, partial [Bacteroidia bacterium]
ISLSATGTSANPIVFQKSGVGANPMLVAYSGGVGTPGTAVQDGLFRMVGSDYITIDGLDLMDPNGSNPATMEYGYGLFKASATDGCQNVTIRNCVITLNRLNNAAGTAPAVDGSRGIDVVNALPTAHTSAVTITAASGTNSNNLFYSNTIQNCNVGIALIGYAASSPFTNADTGNDIGGSSVATGNTIINFGGATAATNPAAGVRTLAQYNLNVSYNTVNNNNGSGVNHVSLIRGIYVNSATSANAAVTNNTLTINGGGTTSQISVIENASGSTAASNTINISNNVISNCTYTTATSATSYFIYNNGATPANLIINNNSISGYSLNPSNSTGSVYFIYNSSTMGSTESIISNTLQNVSNLNTSGSVYFMYNSCSTNNYTVQGNSMNNVSRGGTLGGTMYGFYNFGSPSGGTALVNNNSFTNIGVGGGSNTFYGIYQASTTSQIEMVNNNLVSNITGSVSTIYGLYQGYGATGSTLSNNQVSNLNGGSAMYGIYLGASSAPLGLTAASNTVNTISSTGASVVSGIYYNLGSNTSIYKNKVYDVSVNNAGGTAIGINAPATTGTSTLNIYNNLIGDLRAPISSNATGAIIGINLNSTSTNANLNVYYNSIYINGSSTGANFGTSGIFHTSSATATTAQLNLRNNIVVNTSTAMGTGITAAFRRSAVALGNYATTSNNNLFYAGTPSATNVLYYDGTNSYQTMGVLKPALSPREGNSVTENPPFISIVGSSPNFLNINPATPTQIESGAVTIAGITDDYAGTIRNVSTPDIGAWEGNFTLADLSAPLISAIGYASSGCSLSVRTVTANLSDASGVATGALAPRVYYKVNAGPYTSVQGTLISGTVNNGVWSFALTYAASISDVISYYVVAQDVASSPNVGANPSAGFAATNVNTVSSPPTTPLTYTISTVLNGVYTVGASGTFTTLTAAANAYNTSCLGGPVTFQLIDPLYSSAETFPVTFLNNSDASSTNSLLIVPNTGVNAVVTATSSATAVVKFLNARFITMDGLNSGGSSLTLNSTSTSTTANIWMASTPATGPGCNTIGLKNMTLNGGSNTATQFGIVAGIDGAVPSATGGQDIDNVTITGNTILKNYYGIFASGTTSVTAGGLDNWTVNANTIGPVTSGTNTIGFAGIYVQNMLNLAISSNLVQNVITASSANGGIYLASGVNTAVVSQNTVNMVTTNSTGSGSSSISGIYLGLNVINSSVSKNTVSSIYNTNAGGYGARGIMLSTNVVASNDAVENNMISDIVSYSDPSAAYWPIGIALESATGGVNINYNTVSLTGSHPGLTSATGASPLYVNTGTTAGLSIRDNIFSNTYDNSSSTNDIDYSIYSTSAIGSFSVMNYNDYYVGGSASSLVLGYLGGNQATLAAIQTSFGGNLNSQNTAPVFTSVTDLHLVPASNVALDNTGTPIAGITTDIDGQTR